MNAKLAEKRVTAEDVERAAFGVSTLEECREAVRMYVTYFRAHPDDYAIVDVGKVISKIIDANGWNAHFPSS